MPPAGPGVPVRRPAWRSARHQPWETCRRSALRL